MFNPKQNDTIYQQQLAKLTNINRQNRNQEVSDYQFTPQIIKKSGVHPGRNKENKSLSGERRVTG